KAVECARRLLSRSTRQPPRARCPEILPARFLAPLQIFPPALDASARGPPDMVSLLDPPESGSSPWCLTPTASQWSLRPASYIRPALFRLPAQSARVRPSTAVSIPLRAFRWPGEMNFHRSPSSHRRLH